MAKNLEREKETRVSCWINRGRGKENGNYKLGLGGLQNSPQHQHNRKLSRLVVSMAVWEVEVKFRALRIRIHIRLTRYYN